MFDNIRRYMAKKPTQSQPTILIVVEGGVVSGVIGNPAMRGVKIILKDFDNFEGGDDLYITSELHVKDSDKAFNDCVAAK